MSSPGHAAEPKQQQRLSAPKRAERATLQRVAVQSGPDVDLTRTPLQPPAGTVAQRVPKGVRKQLSEKYGDAEGGKVLEVGRLLEQAGIPYRFGGSLAANLHGASRTPQDIDIEVPDGAVLDQAIEVFNGLDRTRQDNGLTVRVREGGREENIGAFLELFLFSLADGQAEVSPDDEPVLHFNVDITNENNPRFIDGLVAPRDRGDQPEPGSLVGPYELIVNYLHRMVMKPQVATWKGDGTQVLELLHATGFNDDGESWERLQAAIAPLAGQNTAHLLAMIEQLVRDSQTADDAPMEVAPAPPTAASTEDTGPAPMEVAHRGPSHSAGSFGSGGSA